MILIKSKITTTLPGPKSSKILSQLKKLNIGFSGAYPFVHSKEGSGCYFKDIDNNVFLDFASQIGSNPLGYNHHDLNEIIKKYKKHPIKYAGQDFTIEEHLTLLKELTSITPPGLNSAFLINSGAEAVENSIKLALRKQKQAKYGISFEGAFHGRTLGALSCTNSKSVHKKNFFSIPVKRLPFNENAIDSLNRILRQESSSQEIGFIIIEPIQGEGGYNIAPQKLVKEIRKITQAQNIPFISDEVQSGLGRTGKWWAIQNFNVKPDIMSSAKALQVGATIANKSFIPEQGTVSSTWGGGNSLDLAIGTQTIKTIKKRKLLNNINKQGAYIKKRLQELENKNLISKARGLGLMIGFDLPNVKIRNNFIIECLKNGLVLLGCGEKSVRVIPPYIINKQEIDEAMSIIHSSLKKIINPRFQHYGPICNYLTCGETVS